MFFLIKSLLQLLVNFSSLIDESEETKRLNLEEDQAQPQLPSDEDMEDILEHIDEDVEIPDDDDEEDLEGDAKKLDTYLGSYLKKYHY